VVIFHEPTPGPDHTTPAISPRRVVVRAPSPGTAALYVTHDLAVIGSLARRVLVMYSGALVETGPREVLFQAAAHPYTRKLLRAAPDIAHRRVLEALPGSAPPPGARSGGCVFTHRCEFAIAACAVAQPPLLEVGAGHRAACIRTNELEWHLPPAAAAESRARQPARVLLSVEHLSASYGPMRAVDDASLDLAEDECVALVGDSGSGKSTLARAINGLFPGNEGTVRLRGAALAQRASERSAEQRRELQYIFQNPYGSLNPRHRVEEIVATPLRFLRGERRRDARRHVREALERVALSGAAAAKYPDQLSGGERQRVAIARALVCRPSVLVCDEITSALDVSVQATIVELLNALRVEEKLGLLFITHNLALVRSVADRTIIMRGGRVIEQESTDELLDNPKDPYTRQLLLDTPRPLVSAGRGSAEGAT
jgi:peptide/nickel transport system ATP-binding protein